MYCIGLVRPSFLAPFGAFLFVYFVTPGRILPALIFLVLLCLILHLLIFPWIFILVAQDVIWTVLFYFIWGSITFDLRYFGSSFLLEKCYRVIPWCILNLVKFGPHTFILAVFFSLTTV